MKAAKKRELAKACLQTALNEGFQKASILRQQAYMLDPPGTIGIDWFDQDAIWQKDKQFLDQMDMEPFTDLENTKSYIQSLKAGIFIDYILDFRDNWTVVLREGMSSEKICCPQLEQFLLNTGFAFPCLSRLHIYAQTKRKNINARLYSKACKNDGYSPSWEPSFFPMGEYDLGFWPNTPTHIIENRRKWLADNSLFQEMQEASIPGFPKTFQTFQKHKLSNSLKYQSWVKEYKIKK